MKKIVCVILPDYVLQDQFTNTPEGAFRIHAILKLAGHTSHLLDLRKCGNDYELESVVRFFLNIDYDYFFISATTAQAGIANVLAKAIKKKCPNSMIVMGGTHVNAIVNSDKWNNCDLLNIHPDIDCFAQGYYWNENDINRLISQIAKSTIIYGNGLQTKDMIIPLPYEDLQNNCVSQTGGVMRNGEVGQIPTQNMLISVGCAFDCSFCFNEFTKCSRPDPSSVVKEMGRRVTRYGIKGIKINDDDAFQNCKWNEEFINCYRASGLELKFLASTRGDLKHGSRKLRNLIELNVLCGLSVLGIGLEWASDKVLALANKKITVADVKQSIESLNDNTNCEILLYSIYGLPGMDDRAVDDMIEFIQWAKGKIRHISMTNFVPLIGTDIYEHPEKYDMSLMVPPWDGNNDWEKFYFSGKFDDIKAIGVDNTIEWFLQSKLKVYKCLDECGFLRKETKRDAEKAGYLL